MIRLSLVLFLGAATLVSAQPMERYTMALTGDSIITRKLSVYEEPEFLSMIELIRSADVAFTNVEILFHDYESYPMASSGGTYMRAQPEIARELAWAGFDLGSLANNHSGDYGPPAILLTEKYVREAGMTGAGIGKSLAEAREAKFLETAKARIAFISVASTFPDHAMARRHSPSARAQPLAPSKNIPREPRAARDSSRHHERSLDESSRGRRLLVLPAVPIRCRRSARRDYGATRGRYGGNRRGGSERVSSGRLHHRHDPRS